MARIEAESKGGFFATPPEMVDLINQRLKFFGEDQEKQINFCDPCAGEGTALKQMADALAGQGATVETYGIEPEEGRAQKAKNVLNHVIADGYEAVRMTNQALSAMYLNPPYQGTRSYEREEVRFLRDLTEKRIQPGGLFIFCIPQEILRYCAGILANRFRDIKIYRFTDEYYKPYRQVILFGYRREKSGADKKTRQLRDWIKEIAQGGPSALAPLDREDGVIYTVPAAIKEVALFRGSKLDEEEIQDVLDNSDIFDRMKKQINPPKDSRVEMKTPVMPLKPAHMGTAIAAGAVGGNMGSHIVTGTTRKTTEVSEKSENTVAKTEKMITTIKVFSPEHGIVKLE